MMFSCSFAKDSSFSDSQIVSLLGIAQELLQQSRGTQMKESLYYSLEGMQEESNMQTLRC